MTLQSIFDGEGFRKNPGQFVKIMKMWVYQTRSWESRICGQPCCVRFSVSSRNSFCVRNSHLAAFQQFAIPSNSCYHQAKYKMAAYCVRKSEFEKSLIHTIYWQQRIGKKKARSGFLASNVNCGNQLLNAVELRL